MQKERSDWIDAMTGKHIKPSLSPQPTIPSYYYQPHQMHMQPPAHRHPIPFSYPAGLPLLHPAPSLNHLPYPSQRHYPMPQPSIPAVPYPNGPVQPSSPTAAAVHTYDYPISPPYPLTTTPSDYLTPQEKQKGKEVTFDLSSFLSAK